MTDEQRIARASAEVDESWLEWFAAYPSSSACRQRAGAQRSWSACVHVAHW